MNDCEIYENSFYHDKIIYIPVKFEMSLLTIMRAF